MELYEWNILLAKVTSFLKNIFIPLFMRVTFPNIKTSYVFKISDKSKSTFVEGICVFCKIANTTSDKLIYQDELVAAFYDRKQIAQCYIQVIPRTHIPNILNLRPSDEALVIRMWEVGNTLLKERAPTAELRFGFHVPPRNSIDHLHLHCIALPFVIHVSHPYHNWLWCMSPSECLKMIKARNETLDEVRGL